MGDEEQLKKLRDATSQIRSLGDEAVRLQNEENERLRQAVEAQTRAGKDQVKRMLSDLNDPLNYPERESDIEFLPGGKIDPKTLRRGISQWRDADRNEIYTREGYLPLPQIRALRDKVVAQQKVWGGLASGEQSKIQGEWLSSEGKAPSTLPFQDFLQSRALGERFKQLQQNPPRSSFG